MVLLVVLALSQLGLERIGDFMNHLAIWRLVSSDPITCVAMETITVKLRRVIGAHR